MTKATSSMLHIGGALVALLAIALMLIPQSASASPDFDQIDMFGPVCMSESNDLGLAVLDPGDETGSEAGDTDSGGDAGGADEQADGILKVMLPDPNENDVGSDATEEDVKEAAKAANRGVSLTDTKV